MKIEIELNEIPIRDEQNKKSLINKNHTAIGIGHIIPNSVTVYTADWCSIYTIEFGGVKKNVPFLKLYSKEKCMR